LDGFGPEGGRAFSCSRRCLSQEENGRDVIGPVPGGCRGGSRGPRSQKRFVFRRKLTRRPIRFVDGEQDLPSCKKGPLEKPHHNFVVHARFHKFRCRPALWWGKAWKHARGWRLPKEWTRAGVRGAAAMWCGGRRRLYSKTIDTGAARLEIYTRCACTFPEPGKGRIRYFRGSTSAGKWREGPPGAGTMRLGPG